MDDILKRLSDHDKSEKDSSPLDNIFGKSDEPEEEPEAKPEEDIGITHYGKTAGAETGKDGVFQGVNLESRSSADPSGIKGGDMRELSDKDLTISPETSRTSARPMRAGSAGNTDEKITLKTTDQTKIEYLRLIVSLAEEDYYDQAIEALKELRELTKRGH